MSFIERISGKNLMYKNIKVGSILLLSLGIQGCLGSIIGTTADVAIEVVKVPFKVGGAVVDVVTGNDLTDTSADSNDSEDLSAAVYELEGQGL